MLSKDSEKNKLKLTNLGLQDEDIEHLKEFISFLNRNRTFSNTHPHTIKVLDLKKNPITENGAEAILKIFNDSDMKLEEIYLDEPPKSRLSLFKSSSFGKIQEKTAKNKKTKTLAEKMNTPTTATESQNFGRLEAHSNSQLMNLSCAIQHCRTLL